MANPGQDAHRTTVIRSLDSRFLADPLDNGKVHLSLAPSPHFPIVPPNNQSMPNHSLAPLPVCHDLFLQNVTHIFSPVHSSIIFVGGDQQHTTRFGQPTNDVTPELTVCVAHVD